MRVCVCPFVGVLVCISLSLYRKSNAKAAHKSSTNLQKQPKSRQDNNTYLTGGSECVFVCVLSVNYNFLLNVSSVVLRSSIPLSFIGMGLTYHIMRMCVNAIINYRLLQIFFPYTYRICIYIENCICRNCSDLLCFHLVCTLWFYFSFVLFFVLLNFTYTVNISCALCMHTYIHIDIYVNISV